MSSLDVLDFVDAERAGGSSQARSTYYDYAINRVRLSTLITVNDSIGVFGWLAPAHEGEFARQLLDKEASGLRSGRVPIYICPECADLGCGCVSVRLVEDHDSIAWTDFAYEDNFSPPPESFLDIRAFYFDKQQYRTAVGRFAQRKRR